MCVGWGGVGGCLMDDQVSRQQHSPDKPTHTQAYTHTPPCPPSLTSPSLCISQPQPSAQQYSNDTAEHKATGEKVRVETFHPSTVTLVIKWKQPN